MDFRHVARTLLIAAPISICGCIGTTQPGLSHGSASAQAQTHSKGEQKSQAKTKVPCEPPELTTGELAMVGTTPCGGAEIGIEQVTAEPPEIHPN